MEIEMQKIKSKIKEYLPHLLAAALAVSSVLGVGAHTQLQEALSIVEVGCEEVEAVLHTQHWPADSKASQDTPLPPAGNP